MFDSVLSVQSGGAFINDFTRPSLSTRNAPLTVPTSSYFDLSCSSERETESKAQWKAVATAGCRARWLGRASRVDHVRSGRTDIFRCAVLHQLDPGAKHPSSTAPGGCALAQLTVRDPASDRLSTALGALGVEGVTYAKGAARIEARLSCGDGTVTLTTGELGHCQAPRRGCRGRPRTQRRTERARPTLPRGRQSRPCGVRGPRP
jgi:hypothetical protein